MTFYSIQMEIHLLFNKLRFIALDVVFCDGYIEINQEYITPLRVHLLYH